MFKVESLIDSFAKEKEILKKAGLYSPEIKTLLIKNPSHAMGITLELFELSLVGQLVNNIALVGQHVSKSQSISVALHQLNKAHLLTQENYILLLNLFCAPSYGFDEDFNFVLLELNKFSMLTQDKFTLLLEQSLYITNIKKGILVLITKSLISPDNMLFIIQYAHHSSGVLVNLISLKELGFFKKQSQAFLIQNNCSEAIARLNQFNQMGIVTDEHFTLLTQQPRLGPDILLGLLELHKSGLLDSENNNLKLLIENSLRAPQIINALSQLNKQRLATQEHYVLIIQNAEYAVKLVLAMVLLDKAQILNPENEVTLVRYREFSCEIVDFLLSKDNLNQLDLDQLIQSIDEKNKNEKKELSKALFGFFSNSAIGEVQMINEICAFLPKICEF